MREKEHEVKMLQGIQSANSLKSLPGLKEQMVRQ